MLGAVQLGVLAACVVLFVPMGMAGYHLSRNKMLFFSGALFISLAVCVHLTPFFPSLFLLTTTTNNNHNNNNNVIVINNKKGHSSCISLLHQVQYRVEIENVPSLGNSSDGLTSIEEEEEGDWGWVDTDPVNLCGFQKLGRADSSDLFNGSWVVIAGDSQARLLTVSLLRLVLGEEQEEEMGFVKSDLFKRHSDYHIAIGEIGLKLDFVWAPYAENLTDLIAGFKENGSYPDVLVMGAGLWHMLHVCNSSDYGFLLQELRRSVVSFLPVFPEVGSISTRTPHAFWLGMPMLINSMLNTEEKREKMTDLVGDAYEKELYASKLLRQSSGPLLLLDIQMLCKRCGKRCTVDGMHYNGLVYEAAVHILLNALLIESHQKL